MFHLNLSMTPHGDCWTRRTIDFFSFFFCILIMDSDMFSECALPFVSSNAEA